MSSKQQSCDHTFKCNHSTESIHSCVSSVPIFNHLEKEQMAEIMDMVQSLIYKKGEILYHAGDPSDSLSIVNKGKIKIYRLSESGKEQLIRILHPGDFTGELALFTETIHEAYAEAMLETHVCIIKRADVHTLLLRYPTISFKILAEFAARLEQSEKQTTNLATEKVEKRIALYLIECLGEGKYLKQPQEIKLPMTKKDLASYLGTTPETISRKLSDFEEQGYIEQKPQNKMKIWGHALAELTR
ncbi:MAG: Crp/Fnr family transcriptional regulator [Niallia nealsonii]|nr:Crp/Fnr family transcriptional regulator [Niallia nealsonii]